jgi:5-methylcytosine-specific restriction endonuclease McrA
MRPRAQKWHVCSHAGPDGSCPELVNRDNPCPTHGRPVNASWSTDRDRSAQQGSADAVLARDHFTCQKCGHVDTSGQTLEAHHLRPGYDIEAGLTVCSSSVRGCHKALDPSAR